MPKGRSSVAALARGLTERVRRLAGRVGTTVDLEPFRERLPAIEARGRELTDLSDAELTAVANAFDDVDDLLVEACALGREAATRALGERPYDVQLLGAMAMLAGHVAEMATGEGKTLTATMVAYGRVMAARRDPTPRDDDAADVADDELAPDQVHVLTANDYLARRDAEWMLPVYDLLGISVGHIEHTSTPAQRRAAYACDVTYLSVNEAGFDLLRDHLTIDADDVVQPTLPAAIIDEADSICVDEARVPLVLAGDAPGTADPVLAADELVRGFTAGTHYEVVDGGRSTHLTPRGVAAVERELGLENLYAAEHVEQLTALNVALHAYALLERDVDYIVREDRVELVDEFRGRVASRRRWPDGIQSAVEAKERVSATDEGRVLGSITVQALVRLYSSVCGMTGTALSVAEQLREFYELEVTVIPPHRPCIRVDEPTRVYVRAEDKQAAVVAAIKEAHAQDRPVLVGTLDVAESERLAAVLAGVGLDCVVLNAKNDADEAAIIAEAGTPGRITVSTQMAGRGVDIRPGGSSGAEAEPVAAVGGLYVIGYGLHESNRVDDQLRGRAGRQGEPGGSVFFASLEDELVQRRKYGREGLPHKVLADDTGLITDAEVGRFLAHLQRIDDGENLEQHRNTWNYNKVIEHQRVLLSQRRREFRDTAAAAALVALRCEERYTEAVKQFGSDVVDRAATLIALFHVDRCWSEHLAMLADLREGVYLRSMARLNPLDEFRREAGGSYPALVDRIDDLTAETFAEVELTEAGVDLEAAGLVRPTATWTYVVHENPFGSEDDRFFGVMGRMVRRRKADT